MNLQFEVHGLGAARKLDVSVERCVIAGWAGRDPVAIEHHIQELAALGVPRPSRTPLFYHVAVNQLTQADEVAVLGDDSSGEVEVFLVAHPTGLLVSLASDHTDRALESHSVAMSKQICVKPIARSAWWFEDVIDHWDQLMLRSYINDEDKGLTLYQEDSLATLLAPSELFEHAFGSQGLPLGSAMLCGTVPTRQGLRSSPAFEMELWDPVREQRLVHRYQIHSLPAVA